MKKILIALLVLALLCVSLAALAEDEITLQLNTSKVQVYAADDPYLKGLTAEGGTLPVIVVPVKRSFSLQVTVQPRTGRNFEKSEAAIASRTRRSACPWITGKWPRSRAVPWSA